MATISERTSYNYETASSDAGIFSSCSAEIRAQEYLDLQRLGGAVRVDRVLVCDELVVEQCPAESAGSGVRRAAAADARTMKKEIW